MNPVRRMLPARENLRRVHGESAREIDVAGVDMVINYDFPTNGKDYIHRVGRTARAGRSGYAYSFITQ